MMYKGEPVNGIEFYNLLIESPEFTSELGKVVLASGKLEAKFILFLKRNGIKRNFKKTPLGTLIDIAEKNDLLDNNLMVALKQTLKQRNYITHNIYALFTGMIDETIMGKDGLLDSDIDVFIERAWLLKENLNGLSNIFSEKNR